MFSAWLSRRRRLPSRMPCTRPFTISGCALAKPLFTASTSAMTSRLRFDTSALAAPLLASMTSSVFGVQPTQPLSRPPPLGELVLIGVAGDERIFVEHQAERAGRGLRVEVAQHDHGHAGFLREIADEELALVELRGGERSCPRARSPKRCRDRRPPCRRRANTRAASGTIASNCRPSTASASAVVAVAASLPLLSGPQVSLSLIEIATLKPYSFAKNESAFGSRPPLATMRPP